MKSYRVRWNQVDATLPLRVSQPRSAAVIGGGIAGVVAAGTLARRGFRVVVFEQQPYLGGKLGSDR